MDTLNSAFQLKGTFIDCNILLICRSIFRVCLCLYEIAMSKLIILLILTCKNCNNFNKTSHFVMKIICLSFLTVGLLRAPENRESQKDRSATKLKLLRQLYMTQ